VGERHVLKKSDELVQKILVNYSNEKFWRARHACSVSAKCFGGFDRIQSFTKSDIDPEFKERNKNILLQRKGDGFWLWKPYFFLKVLKQSRSGDLVFYSDSGTIFLRSITPIYRVMMARQEDVAGFELPLIECQWTKRELLEAFGADREMMWSNQIMATSFAVIKTERTVAFFEKFLDYACNEFLLMDERNIDRQFPEFLGHRHDQSIFSLLFKSYGYTPMEDPSERGMFPKIYAPGGFDKVKANDDLYCLEKGIFFRARSCSHREQGPILFFHKSNRPFWSTIRFWYKWQKGALERLRVGVGGLDV